MNQYRALTSAGAAWFGDDIFEAEFTVGDERDHLARGLIEIVPRPYRTLNDRYTINGVPVAADEVIELALPVEVEVALVDGGHLARVRRDAHPTVDVTDDAADDEPDPKQRRRRRTSQPVKE